MPSLRFSVWKSRRGSPVVVALFAFWLAGGGGFRGLAGLGWTDVVVVFSLLIGIGMSTIRRLKKKLIWLELHALRRPRAGRRAGQRRRTSWSPSAGGRCTRSSISLMAFLVSFLPRVAGITLLGVAMVFDGLRHPRRRRTAGSRTFVVHGAFLVAVRGARTRCCCSARLAIAREGGARRGEEPHPRGGGARAYLPAGHLRDAGQPPRAEGPGEVAGRAR